jgi:predicted dehydrogenase
LQERFNLAIIGCGSQGTGLASKFAGLAHIEYVCDPDERHRERVKAAVGARQSVADFRSILDNKSIDAVVIATPDHWHAPIAIMACNAGKHVYVEKPQSHNLRESRWLVDAAHKNRVVVQHGTQSRTNPLIASAVQLLREGAIGDVLVAKAWNVQRRDTIGLQQPSPVPAELDYDLWLGPAEALPYQANRLHYHWRWWHNFGTGDIGNDGTHEIDYTRWGLGVTGLPNLVAAIGGKYAFADDQQFPDTATCAFEWSGQDKVGDRRQLIFEMRLWSKSYPFNTDSGAEFYGTAGRMVLSKRGKMELYDDNNKLVKDPKPKQVPELAESHQVDFLDAIRQDRKPNADVTLGHDSVSLVHLANVSLKVGRSLVVDREQEKILDDQEANQLLGRNYRPGHWAVPQP